MSNKLACFFGILLFRWTRFCLHLCECLFNFLLSFLRCLFQLLQLHVSGACLYGQIYLRQLSFYQFEFCVSLDLLAFLWTLGLSAAAQRWCSRPAVCSRPPWGSSWGRGRRGRWAVVSTFFSPRGQVCAAAPARAPAATPLPSAARRVAGTSDPCTICAGWVLVRLGLEIQTDLASGPRKHCGCRSCKGVLASRARCL